MEWFDAGAGAPVAVFMHGGYWQALDRGWLEVVDYEGERGRRMARALRDR